jgi:hypothetical protein
MFVIRQAKLIMKKLGVREYDIGVLLAAVDSNGDGFLDVHDLERLQLIAKEARANAEQKVSGAWCQQPRPRRYEGLIRTFRRPPCPSRLIARMIQS